MCQEDHHDKGSFVPTPSYFLATRNVEAGKSTKINKKLDGGLTWFIESYEPSRYEEIEILPQKGYSPSKKEKSHNN